MKLIDQNGKVFGVINILDLFLILLLLAAGAFAGLKFMGTDTGGNIGGGGGQQTAITYTLFNSNEHVFVVNRIQSGDVIRSVNSNAVLGTVTDVKVGKATAYVPTADGNMVLSEVPQKNEVYMTLQSNASISGNPVIGGEQILIGNRIRVKGSDYMLDMIISGVDTGGAE